MAMNVPTWLTCNAPFEKLQLNSYKFCDNYIKNLFTNFVIFKELRTKRRNMERGGGVNQGGQDLQPANRWQKWASKTLF